MSKRNARKSVDHTLRHGVRSMLRSVARRDDFDVPDLATLMSLRHDLDEAIDEAANGLLVEHSYAELARAVGISRQAAFKRWSA